MCVFCCSFLRYTLLVLKEKKYHCENLTELYTLLTLEYAIMEVKGNVIVMCIVGNILLICAVLSEAVLKTHS